MVLCQSRGPFLGMLGGAYVFILVGLLRLRRLEPGSARSPRWAALIRWGVPGTVGVALVALVFLVVANMPGSPLERARDVPYVGRLGSVLDAESRTIQVRLFIWRSVAGLLQSDEPLESPDGVPDSLHRLRPVLGTGPETFALAVNRFAKPKLGQLEALTKTPDRAHNEAFDVFVTGGGLGIVLWLGVFVTVFGLALTRLGLIRSRPQTVAFWAVLAAGAIAGAVTPWLASGEATLSGVGLSVGLILSLALFVTVQALFEGAAAEAVGGDAVWAGLILALLATLVAHMVEIQVGIAITATRLYFWFYAAVVVVAAGGWLAPESSAAGPKRPPSGKRSRKEQRRPAKHGSSSAEAASPADARWADLFHSLMVGSLCIPWVYSMTLSSPEARGFSPILVNSWLGGDGIPTIAHLSALSWIVLVTLLVAAAVSTDTRAAAGSGAHPRRWAAVVPAVVLIAVFAAIQAARVAHAMKRSGAADEILQDAHIVASHFGVLLVTLLVLCLAIGVVLGRAGEEGLRWSRRPAWVVVASGLVLAVGGAVVVKRYNLDPISADSYLKVANHLLKRGRAVESLPPLDRAVALSPGEPMYQLVRGSATLTAARAAEEADTRDRLLESSEAGLRRALELAPLDPDHSANLARCLAHQASVARDRTGRYELLERSSEHYAAAVRLRPNAVVFRNELGRVLLNAGRYDEAGRQLELAVDLDPTFTEPYIALAALAERRAATARARGDAAESLRRLQEAAAIYERALDVEPELEPARKGLARVRRSSRRPERADPP
jgi:tetratricopeptide (TPR) repeat protein